MSKYVNRINRIKEKELEEYNLKIILPDYISTSKKSPKESYSGLLKRIGFKNKTEIFEQKNNTSFEETPIDFNMLDLYNKTDDDFSQIIDIKYKTITEYSKIYSNYFKMQITNKGLSLNLDKNSPTVTAENIGEFVLALVEYVRAEKPDYIVACDRGSRLVGLAVSMLYGRLHGRLPTVDGSLRFRRISNSVPEAETAQHLAPLVDEMLAHRERPKVIVIDDWINSGSTKRTAENIFSTLSEGRIETKYAVLLGPGADVSGSTHSSGFAGSVDWHDNETIIGVNYQNTFRTQPIALHTFESLDYRRRMVEGIGILVDKLKEGQSVKPRRVSSIPGFKERRAAA